MIDTLVETGKTRRVELILRQIDALPTLPAVATRLLAMTASEDTHAREVVRLVSSDPALTARILAICRHADQGIRDEVLTVERAVVLLGFSAVRNAVLSTKIFEVFESAGALPEEAEVRGGRPFDRVGFWRHSLAVAVLAERIAAGHPGRKALPAGEAFVCGLLHDVGKLALHVMLPKSYARVIEACEVNQRNIAEFERRILGLDHHTAGKRLAELWRLPQRLQDCIWLHGSPFATLPRLEHRPLIGLVSLADQLVRRHHLGFSGNFTLPTDAGELIAALDLSREVVEQAARGLHEEMEERTRALALDQTPSRELFLQSIQRANEALGRLNGMLDRRSRLAARQGQILTAISEFHAAALPAQSVQDVLAGVLASAAGVLGGGFYAILYQPQAEPEEPASWLICEHGEDGAAPRVDLIDAPPHAPVLSELDPAGPLSMDLLGLMPWVADYLHQAADLRKVRLLPLRSGWGTSAVLLHDQPFLPPWPQLASLTSTWAAAIAAARRHEGARRLGEELAQANRELAQTQDRLLQQESLARLGEMAAGAAHEMNNPLAVIAGRSQLLAMNLPEGTRERADAATIAEQAHRLSDLITALRFFAEPPRAQRQPIDLPALLGGLLEEMGHPAEDGPPLPELRLEVVGDLPALSLDGEQIRQAVRELVLNALQAEPRSAVTVTARMDPHQPVLLLRVSDDGAGMDGHTLAHALDPFFSAKAAGRRVGMGLPRARQLAAAHGGNLTLRSEPQQGTTATLAIPLDCDPG